MMTSKRVAVYGGSFNPPTMSHFLIMEMILNKVKIGSDPIDEVWMIPCGNRSDKKVTTSGLKRYLLHF